jgi:hypothetical protein
MASQRLGKRAFWAVRVSSTKLSQSDRELIVDFFNEVARHVRPAGAMILDGVIDSKRYCELVIEARQADVSELLVVLRTCKKITWSIYASRSYKADRGSPWSLIGRASKM